MWVLACVWIIVRVCSLEALYQSGLSDWAVNKQLAQIVRLAHVARLNCQTPKPCAHLSQQREGKKKTHKNIYIPLFMVRSL